MPGERSCDRPMSVQKAGNQVLINVQLIGARSDNHLWAESYQRTLDNIFDV